MSKATDPVVILPRNYPSVEASPLSPVELDAKAHWEQFVPSRVKALRAQGGEQAFETAVRAAWWYQAYQTTLAQARNPALHSIQAAEPFREELWPPPETPPTQASPLATTSSPQPA